MRARAFALLSLAVLFVGAALRLLYVGVPAFCCDEFFDVFAARSYLAGDGFQIPGREYTRGLLMTRLTAGSFALFGESEWSARLPALVFGLALLPAIYAAGRHFFGPVAAFVSMALLALSPHAIDTSRYARFYSALTLLMLLSAMAAYAGLEKRRYPWGWLAAAAACALVAATLHPIAVAMGLVVQLYAAGAASVAAARGRRADAMWFAAIVALLVAAEAVAFAVPAIRQLLLRAALEPLPWYQPRAGDEWVYATHLAGQYGWLWYAAPAATVLAVWGGRSGWFVAAAFWVPFAFLTFVGATKHYRYAIPILPFVWLLWGGAAEQLVRSWDIGALARRLLAMLRRRPAVALLIVALALGGTYALAKYTPSVRASLRRPTLSDSMLTTGFFYDWRTLQRELAPRLPSDAVIVSDGWFNCIYYLQRPSYQLLAGFRRLGAGDWETPERDDADKVLDVEHLRGLQERTPGGPVFVIASRERWRSQQFFRPSLTRAVEQGCSAVPVSVSFVVVYECRGAPAS